MSDRLKSQRGCLQGRLVARRSMGKIWPRMDWWCFSRFWKGQDARWPSIQSSVFQYDPIQTRPPRWYLCLHLVPLQPFTFTCPVFHCPRSQLLARWEFAFLDNLSICVGACPPVMECPFWFPSLSPAHCGSSLLLSLPPPGIPILWICYFLFLTKIWSDT